MDLPTKMSLLLSKYKNIKDDDELIFLLNLEFNEKYTKNDILNYYVSISELEIEHRKYMEYGDLNRHEYTY